METQSVNKVTVPIYYRPWPHQQAAWGRRRSGKYTYYFKLWARQAGKDTDDIQYCLARAWDNPGTQQCYVGLDNVWISNNIFKKYIDGRTHWMDYPEDMIEPKDTQKEVLMLNNPPEYASSRIKFIGFLNDQGLIGSSYDGFTFSETSLYASNAFQFIQPIWDRKLAMGLPLEVEFNGTPRGIRNIMYEMLRTYTGIDDPEEMPGDHGNCYVDKVTIKDLIIPDGHGGWKKMYTEEDIEQLKDRYLRQFGNLNLYYQEHECSFATVNAGLVYQGIAELVKEKRYTSFNLNTAQPVYAAFDISSKGKETDATAGIVFQFYNNRFMIYDIFEERGKALVDCISDLAVRPYFKYIRFVALPWDSERSASSETPLEECQRMFPNINWHALSMERVDRGIMQVRRMLPNMVINSDNCDYLMDCFNNYEYKYLSKQDDWTAKPIHNRYSHLMDALRYAVMAVNEIDYLQLNAYGADPWLGDTYGGFYTPEEPKLKLPITYMKPKRERTQGYGGFYDDDQRIMFSGW